MEIHIFCEALANARVNFRLEIEQGSDHVERLFLVGLVGDDVSSLSLDVRLHLVDDVLETVLMLDLDE